MILLEFTTCLNLSIDSYEAIDLNNGDERTNLSEYCNDVHVFILLFSKRLNKIKIYLSINRYIRIVWCNGTQKIQNFKCQSFIFIFSTRLFYDYTSGLNPFRKLFLNYLAPFTKTL